MDETEAEWQARMDAWLLDTMNKVRAEAGRPLLTELPPLRTHTEPQEPDEEEAYLRRHGRRSAQ